MAKRHPEKLDSVFHKAIATFMKHDGILRTSQALHAKIHPATLYAMRDQSILKKISRGVYRLANHSPLSQPDLVTVATRIPNGVVCLLSALSFHNLTTQIPHDVHVALACGTEPPRLKYPPIKTYRFSEKALKSGIETHKIDGIDVKIYSVEKTLADCFKFRNKIGLDTMIEAIRLYRERKKVKINELMHYAAICRVTKTIRPYIESIL